MFRLTLFIVIAGIFQITHAQQSQVINSSEALAREIALKLPSEKKAGLTELLRERAVVYDQILDQKRGDIAAALIKKDPQQSFKLMNELDAATRNKNATLEGIELLESNSTEVVKLREPDRVLEQMVRENNPTLPICESKLSWTGPETVTWKRIIETYFPKNAWMSSSVARVEQIFPYKALSGRKVVTLQEMQPTGTAFLVSATRLITAYHVIDGRFNSDGSIDPEKPLQLNFGAEYNCPGTSNSPVVKVKRVPLELIDKSHDIAVLEIDTIQGRRPFELAESGNLLLGESVVVFGFPGEDPTIEKEMIRRMLAVDEKGNSVANIKRFAPGDFSPDRCEPMNAVLFGHNATTFGNNSGSPIIRISDNKVVGIHREGQKRICNYAIRAEHAIRLLTAGRQAIND